MTLSTSTMLDFNGVVPTITMSALKKLDEAVYQHTSYGMSGMPFGSFNKYHPNVSVDETLPEQCDLTHIISMNIDRNFWSVLGDIPKVGEFEITLEFRRSTNTWEMFVSECQSVVGGIAQMVGVIGSNNEPIELSSADDIVEVMGRLADYISEQ